MAGVSQLCGPAAGYSCTGAGYAGKSEGWPGALYGRGYASSNRYGFHNCTLYAAFRLWKNGLGNPGWSGNATLWDTRAPASKVDQTPAVGSIAQWNRGYGHVAYVEKVTSSYIEISDDNYGYNWTDRFRIARNSPAMPDNFIHLKDVTTSAPIQAPSAPTLPPPSGPTADQSPPTAPTSPAASAPTTSTISLSWGKGTDDVGVVGYSVYRAGTRIANSSATSYKFSGLSCGTAYKLGVDAYDAAGNRSSVASVTASTAACPKTVSVSKGARVNVSGCSSTACAYVTVNLSKFGSGSHTVSCYSDYPPPTGVYYTYTTSSTTSNVCIYGYASTHVWVKVDGVESNHLTW